MDVNGSDTDPVFEFVKERTKGLLGSMVKWNFTKFLVAPDGMTVTRYSPTTDPAELVDGHRGAARPAEARVTRARAGRLRRGAGVRER